MAMRSMSRVRLLVDYLLTSRPLRPLDRRLRPHRYWTQAELDVARAGADQLRRELGW